MEKGPASYSCRAWSATHTGPVDPVVLAAGQTDIAMDAHMETYDIAPLIPIIEGAGGVVSTWTSGVPTPGGNVIAASSRILLDEALAVIAAGNADE